MEFFDLKVSYDEEFSSIQSARKHKKKREPSLEAPVTNC